MLRICLGCSAGSAEFQDDSSYQAAYKNLFKPLGALLFANPGLAFSFRFSGPQIESFKKKNPEFLDLVKNLVSRKQAEIVGGGYYNPIFPLIYPVDRAAQIERLSLSIRQHFGKRPRGAALFCDCWDPSLLTAFDAANLEYVLLDESLLPPGGRPFVPIVMNNLGKSAFILPLYSSLAVQEGEGAKKYLSRLAAAVQKAEGGEGEALERTVCVPLPPRSIRALLEGGWVEEALSFAGEGGARFDLPSNCVRSAADCVPRFVHAGINGEVARRCPVPYERSEGAGGYPASVYDYLQAYGASRRLYDRMMNVSMLVNQCHGDKMRKNAAREKLLAAQSGEAYISRAASALAAFKERQSAYKNLTEAERIVRECSAFKESVTSYDYNGDGFKEYVCRLEKCDVCVGADGGSIFELDVIKANGNYADNISRVKKYDGVDDNYFRGIFVDHLFEDGEAKKYCRGEPCRNGMFSAKKYKEVSFSSARQEIQLEARTKFSTLDQPILLRKNYVIKSNGISVQYILKNEGPVAVQGKFAVESNFAELNLLAENYKPYTIEIVSGESVVSGTSLEPCRKAVPDGLVPGAAAAQVTDPNAGVSFVFTPNEEAGVTFFPVKIKRRNLDADVIQNESQTFVVSFVWDVNLAAGMEVEKTVAMTITQSRKRRK